MTIVRKLFAGLLALVIAAPVFAQAQRTYSQPELDQMLAPVALYPDSLLSQVLMAATYPIEVAEAARWSRANPGLQGEDAVRAVQNEDWDPSVKSLLAFPQILQRMDERDEWTRALGDAFLAQEPQMMDQVQQLRRRAQATGNLRSDEQINVEQQGPVIVVRPASPQYVYVPYYDPLLVYGPWWWPGYQPVVWAPWPGYVRPYRPGISVGFWWGRPVGLSLNFFFGDFDWQRRHVRVVHSSNYYYRSPVFVSRSFANDRDRWQHDPIHRRGADYRAAEVRQRFVNAPLERRQTRREVRRVETQAAPTAVQPQPAASLQAQPSVQPRAERRAERQTARAQPQAAAPVQVQARPATPVRVQTQRAAAPAQVQAQRVAPAHVQTRPQPQLRQAERQPAMPAAQAPQVPRADRQEQRQERREQRQERREERAQKAG